MGETYRTFYSDGFPSDGFGLITGSGAVNRFPNIPGKLFRLQGRSANKGSFFVGNGSGTNQRPWEIDASYETEWFNLASGNLNQLFYDNASGSADVMVYWVQN